jgi:hypothetical protein
MTASSSLRVFTRFMHTKRDRNETRQNDLQRPRPVHLRGRMRRPDCGVGSTVSGWGRGTSATLATRRSHAATSVHFADLAISHAQASLLLAINTRPGLVLPTTYLATVRTRSTHFGTKRLPLPSNDHGHSHLPSPLPVWRTYPPSSAPRPTQHVTQAKPAKND